MRAFTVAKRLIKQISQDKRSIGLMFFAPVFIIFLLNVIFTSAVTKPKIDVVKDNVPDAFINELEKDAVVYVVSSVDIAIQEMKDQIIQAYVVFVDGVPQVTVEGSDPSVSKMTIQFIKKANIAMRQQEFKDQQQDFAEKQKKTLTTLKDKLSTIDNSQLQALAGMLPSPDIFNALQTGMTVSDLKVEYLYGSENMEIFDAIAPLFMGFFIFFFVFLLAGISFLRERISGTLERILATPLKRIEIVMGYFLGFGLFIAIQTVIIQCFILYGLNITMKGNFFTVLLINLLLAGQSLALGTLLSAFAKNEFQLFQFIPIIIVPQIMFSGLFDLSEAPIWVKILSEIFPLTHGANALTDVVIRGLGFMDIYLELLIITAYGVVFLILNSLALKKYRRI